MDANCRPDAQSIRRLLQRCLVRDLRKRLPDIGVARLEIDDAVSGAHAPAVPRRLTPLWPVAIATGVLGIAIGAAAAFNSSRAELANLRCACCPLQRTN